MNAPLPPWPWPLKLLWASNLAWLMAMLAEPRWWSLGMSFILISQGIVVLVGLCPRCPGLGPVVTRLDSFSATPVVFLTLDDGPDPHVTPAVLALLAQHNAHASFFCIGTRAAAHPDLCRSMVQAGHTVENHGQCHSPLLPFSGRRGWQREIDDAQVTLAGITGFPPRYYRAMAGLRNPFLAGAVARQNLTLVSWTRRGFDTRATTPQRVLTRLLRRLASGDILLLHDGQSHPPSRENALVLDILPLLLTELQRRGYAVQSLPDPTTSP